MSVRDNIDKCKELLQTGITITRELTPVVKANAIAFIDNAIAVAVEYIREVINSGRYD